MPVLLGIPVLMLTMVIQTTAFSRLPLLYGTADIVMLVILAWMLNDRVKHGWEWVIIAGLITSFVSGLPPLLPLVGYLMAAGLAYWLKKRIWQTPVLAMLFSTFLGTVMVQSLSLITLIIMGTEISLPIGYSLVIMPSALWNLILAVPVYTLVSEMVGWVYMRESDL